MRRLKLAALLASTSLSAAGSLFLVPSGALANPQGGSVVSGGATIVQSPATPNRLVINQTTESAVLNWQSFSIGAGQQVIFQQPNAAAIALNRVTGNQASEIAGTLTANGQVWLVNPNGVFFGRGAVVNVAGIVATTSNITPSHFMAGNYVFDQPGVPGAAVVNAGRINVRDGGLAAFVAPSVANSGMINARLGKVALASGNKFTVDLYGDDLVKFAVDAPTASAMTGAAVDNSGAIKADGGTVTLSVAAAQTLVDHAINVGGTIQARTASMQNGKIVLSGGGGTVTVSGTLDASGKGAGETGGTAEVLGGAVALAPTAKIDVSGTAGGGTVLVGGNFHGAGPQPNAVSTTISQGAVIDADAVQDGNGGKVAVWSDQATSFDGVISARGGAHGGNGGSVETSSRLMLSIGPMASVDTRAPLGKTGSWLLDPASILIDDTDPGSDDDIATDATDYPNFPTGSVASGDGGADAAYLSPAALVTQLMTTNVSLAATNSINFGTNTGIAGGITSASANSLTLTAGTSIDFAAAANGISIAGGIKATAPSVTLGTALSGGAGGVDLSGSTTDTLAAASITISATNAAIKLGGTVAGSGADTLTLTPGASGTVSLQAVGTTIPVEALTVTNGATTLNGNVTTNGGGQTYGGAVTLGASVTLSDQGSGVIAFNGTLAGGGNAITVLDDAPPTFGATVSGLGAATLAPYDAANTIAVGDSSLEPLAAADTSYDFVSTGTLFPLEGGAVAGTVTIGSNSTTGAITLSQASPALNLALVNGGAGSIGVTGTYDGTGSLALTAGSGGIALGADVTASAGIAATASAVTLGGNLSGGAGGVDLSATTTDTLNATVTISATNAAIKLGGDVEGSGTDTLTLTPGAAGSVSLQTIGAVTPVASLTVTDGAVTLGGMIATGAGGADLSGTTTDTLAAASVTISADNGAILVGGNVAGAGADTLTLTPGASGTVSLQSIGNITAVSALTVTDGAATLGGDIATGTGGADLSGTTTDTLAATVTISATNGAIKLGGNVLGFGTDTLTLTPGASGTVSLQSVGNTTAVSALSVTNGALTLGGDVATGAGGVDFSGTSTDTLTADVTVSAANAAILLGSLVVESGTDSLTLTPGAGGSASLLSVAVDALTVTNGAATLGGTITAGAGGADLSGTSTDTLAANVTISAANAAILLGGTVVGSGTDTLTLTPGAAGSASLQAIGTTVAVDGLTVTNGATTLGGDVSTGGGGQSYGGAVTLGASVTLTDKASGAIAFNSTLAGAGNAITIVDDAPPSFGGTVSGLSAASLAPFDGPNTIAVGDSSLQALAGAATSYDFVSTGGLFPLEGSAVSGTVTIGVLGAITMTQFSPTLNLALVTSGTGAIHVNGAYAGVGSLALTSEGTGAIVLSANVSASGGVTAAADSLTLGASLAGGAGGVDLSATTTDTLATASVTISATNTAIKLGGNVVGSGSDTLTLTPGVSGTASLQAIGNTTAVDALTVTNGAATLGGTIATGAGGADLSGTTTDTLAANVTISAANGAIRLGGNVLGSGTDSLTVTPGSGGSVSLQAVGNTTAVDALTVTNGAVTLKGNIATGTGGADLSGTTTDTLGAASVTISASNAAIKLGGNVLGAGTDTLTLTPGASGTVSLQAVGNTTAVDALTVSNGTATLGGTIATGAGGADLSGTTADDLAASVTISAANGAIKLGSNVLGSGTDTLTLTPGATGSVSLQGVGNTTAVQALTVTNGAATLGGDIATGSGGADLSGTTTDTLAAASVTISAANGAIKLGGNVLGAGSDTLTLTPGASGTVSLLAVGNTTAVDALTVTNGAATLGGNITTGAGGADLSGTTTDTLATASVTISAANGAIKLGGNVLGAGSDTLTLTPGATGTVSLQDVGDTTAVDALTVTNGAATLGGTITTGAGGADLSGTTTDTLAAATVSISAVNAAIKLGGNVLGSGTDTLTLSPGTTGTVSLKAVGNTTAVDALTVTDGTVTLGGHIATGTGGADFSGTTADTLAAASVTISASNAAINLGGNVLGAGTDTLTLTPGATGTVSLQEVGNSTAVDALTVSNGSVTLGGNIATTSGGADLSGTTTDSLAAASVTISATNAAIKLGGNVLGSGTDTLTLTAGTTGTVSLQGVGNTTSVDTLIVTNGAATLGGTLATGAGGADLSGTTTDTLAATVTISAANAAIKLGGNVLGSGTDALTLTPGSSGTVSLQVVGNTIAVDTLTVTNGAATLHGAIATGAGGADLSGTTTDTLAANVTISAANGAIKLGGNVLGSGTDTLTLTPGASGSVSLLAIGNTIAVSGLTVTNGAATLGGAITTGAGGADLSGTATDILAANVSISASNGAIKLGGNVLGSGTDTLTLTPGSTGTVSLQAVGNTTAVDALSVTNGAITLAGNVTTSGGGQAYDGAVTLTGSVTLADTGGGAIAFQSTIDGASAGNQALSVATSGGTITFSGMVGSSTPLGAVTLADSVLDIAANVNVAASDAAFSETGATRLQGGTNATSTTIATANGDISFLGTIDGTAANSQSMHLNAGAGTIALSGNVGSGFALSAVSLADSRLDLSANVTLSGDFSETGATLLQGGTNGTVTTIATSAGGITFSSTIDADQAGLRALSLSATAGTIALQGNLGAGTALGSVFLSDTVLDLASNVGVTLSDAEFSQTGATILQGGTNASATTIATADGDIVFSSTISGTGTGAQALNLNAGTGVIALQGNLGTGSALGAVTLSDLALDISPNVAITISGASFSETGATELLGNGTNATATTIATSGGNIGFSAAIDGATAGLQSLSLGAGAGTITLSGNVGATHALGQVSLSDGTLSLGPDVTISTSGGAFSQTGTTVLLGGTNATVSEIATTASGSAGANINFSSAINGTGAGDQSLVLAAGANGTIALSGTVGATAPLGAVTLTTGEPILIAHSLTTSGGNVSITSGSSISISAPVDAGVGGEIALTAAGAIDIAAALGATTTGAITLAADSGQTGIAADALTITASVGNSHAGTMILTGAAISIGGSVDGGGALSIGPSTASANIGLGNGAGATADTFNLSAAGIADIGGDFTAVSIATSGGAVQVDNGGSALTFAAPPTLSGTAIALTSSLATSGKAVTLIGPVTLDGSVTLDTTAGGATAGANIDLADAVDAANSGTQALTVKAGTGGTIALSGSIGAGTAVGAVSLTDKELDLSPGVAIATAGGSFSQTGATLLEGGTNAGETTIATSGGNLAFSGTVDATAPGAQALNLNAGAGTITLSGALGAGTVLGAITLDDHTLDLGASLDSIRSNAAFSQTGATVLAGAATTIATGNGNIGFSGTIDGTSLGAQALTLQAGSGTITLSGAVGAATPLGALNLTGGVLAIDAPLSGAAISVAGSTGILFDDTGAGAAVTSTGGQTYSGPITLDAATSLTDTGGNAIIFQNAIDGLTAGGQALDVSTGGTVALSISVGAGTALGAVTLSGSTVALDASIQGGAISVTGSTGILFDHTGGGAAVTSRGGQTYSGAITLQANTSLTDSGGHAITFDNAIDGISAGAQALNVGTSGGTVTLSGAAGAGTALGAVTLAGAVVALDASVSGGAISVTGSTGILFDHTGGGAAVTSTGGQTYSGAVTLQANTSLTDSNGHAIAFDNAVDGTSAGAQALNVGTSGGTLTLSAAVGAGTALGAVTLSGGVVALDSTISGGAISVTGSTGIPIDHTGGGAAVISTGGQTYSGAVTLEAGTSLADTGGGTIAFHNAIDGTSAGADALTVGAAGGTVALSGSVGSATALGAVTLSGGVVALDASLSGAAVSVSGSTGILFDHAGGGAAVTSTGGQSYDGPVTLQAATSLTDSGGNAIAFANSIDGAQALSVATAGGTITLSGAVGSVTPLGAVTLSGAVVALDASVSGTAIGVTGTTGILFDHSGGGAAVTSTSGQTYDGVVVLQADVALTDTGGNAINFQSTVDGTSAGAQSLSVTSSGGTVALSDAVGAATPLGAVTLSGAVVAIDAPVSGGAITVSGTSGIRFDYAGAGAAVISTGGQTYEGAVSLQASTSLTDSGGGAISFQNSVDAAAAGSQTLSIATSGGTIAFLGNVGAATPLGAVTLADRSLSLGPGISFATADAPLSQSGATILAGAGPSAVTVQTSGGNLSFGGAIDGTIPGDQALTLKAGAGTIALAGSVGAMTPLGAVTLSDAMLALAPNVGIATANAPISQTGATVLGGTGATAATIASSNGAITFAGTIDGTALGQQALDLSAGLGTITLSGDVGSATPLATVTFADATLAVSGSVAIATGGGGITQTGATLLEGGASATTLSVASAGGTIEFAGSIDGDGVAPRGLSLAAGAGTISLGGTLGGMVPLGAVTLTDAVLDLGANAGIETANAPISQSGATVLGGAGPTAATIASSGGDIAFGGTIDGTLAGDQALTIAAGAGTVSLAANVGATTPLGAVTITDGALALAANVGITTFDADISLTGATVLGGTGATAAILASSGGTITLAGTLDGTVAGDQALTLSAGTGEIALSAKLGSTTALASLTLASGALEIAGNVTIATAGGAFLETGPFVLPGGTNAGTVTIDTTGGGSLPAGANITFASTIDDSGAGKQALTLIAGGGTIALDGNVGATTPLAALTMSDAALDLGANVAIVTAGGAVSQTGPTVLGGGATPTATTIMTSAGGASANITFDGSINGGAAGNQSLVLAAGAGGTVTLRGNVGGATPLGAVTLGGGAIDLGADIVILTLDGAVSADAPVTLLGGAAPSSVFIGTQGAGIVFTGTVDGTVAGDQSVALDAGAGTVSLQGNIGATTALRAVTLDGGTIALAGNISITTAGGAVALDGPVALVGTGATTATIDTTQAGRVRAGADISLVSVDGSLAGDQALTLEAGTGGTISVQTGLGSQTALGAVSMSDAALDLAANAGIATFGGAVSQTGAILLGGGFAATLTTIDTTDGGLSGGANISLGVVDGSARGSQSVRLAAGSGTIALDGAVGASTALGAVSLSDAVLQIGANVSLQASGGAIDQAGATILLGTAATSTFIETDAGVTFSGAIDGSLAGKQSLSITGGAISLGQSVGAGTPLGALTLDGSAIALGPNFGITTAGGSVSFYGAVAAAGSVTIDTTAGNTKPAGAAILFESGFDGAGALSLDAGSDSPIALLGSLGETTPLAAVTFNDATLNLAANVTITTAGGPFTQTGATVLIAGTAPSVSAIDTSGGTITLAGTIDASAAGAQGLTLNAGAPGTILLRGNIGKTTPLGALSMNDGLLAIAPNVGIVTAGGAVSNTGPVILLGGTNATATTIATNGGLAGAGASIALGGAVDGAVAGDQALTLNAGTAGTVTLGGNVGAATALGAVTLSGGSLFLPANFALTTAGGAVAIGDNLSAAASLLGSGPTVTRIDTTNGGGVAAGANITLEGTFDGSIAGAQALTLDAGTGGTIALFASLGATTPLGAITMSDAVLLFEGSADLQFITTAGGAISETGATLVQAGPGFRISTAGGAVPAGADVTFAGTIDTASPLADTVSALSVNAGTGGTIALMGDVGSVTPISTLTFADAELDLAPNISITSNLLSPLPGTSGLLDSDVSFSQTGATVLLGGTQSTLTTINSATGNEESSITFAGPIDATAPGRQALSLDAGLVTLLGSIGAHTPLGALTLTGVRFQFAGNIAITTAGAPVTEVPVAGVFAGDGANTLEADGATPTLMVVDTTAAGTMPAGANVTFVGGMTGGSAGLQSLTVAAGTSGTIAFSGGPAIGGGFGAALGALNFTDAELVLDNIPAITTAGGTISQTGATILTGSATPTVAISTAGDVISMPLSANVTFAGPIDGSGAVKPELSIDAGTAGTIALLGNVGATTALGGLALADAALQLGPGLSISLAGGDFRQSGATVLLGGAGPTTTSITAADIVVEGNIDGGSAGAQALVLNAASGNIELGGGAVGGTTPLGALTLNDSVLVIGGGFNITTAGGAVSETGATIVVGSSVLDTTAGGTVPAGANVTFGGAIDGSLFGSAIIPTSLSVNAGSDGTITLASAVGAHTALGALSLADAALIVPAGFSVSTAGGAVSETGVTFVVGGATSFSIDTTAGGAMPGGANITFGDVNGGALALSLDAGSGGTVALLGNLGSVSALASLSLTDGGLALGGNASITTAGTPFTETGATILRGAGTAATLATIDTTDRGTRPGADITFGPIDGGVAGKQSLTLEAGGAAIALDGSVGTATALGALSLEGAILRLAPSIAIATAGGAVSQSGATVLLDPPPVGTAPTLVSISTGGGAIGFGGAIEGTTAGGQALSLKAGSGTVSLAAGAGDTVPLGGLAVSGGAIDLAGTQYQTVDGAITLNGTVNLTAPMVLIATIIPTSNGLPATTGANVSLSFVSAPTTELTLDPGIDAASIGGGSLMKISILEGSGSSLTGLVVGETSLGGQGVATNLTVGGFSGIFAAAHAFIRPGGVWTVNANDALILDPALLGLTNSVLSNEGVSTAIALMNEIQLLIARGDTGETAAQQAFLQSPERPDYAVDPFRQRYNILGVTQENVGGFEDLSYVTDGFWEGLLKKQ